MVDNRARPLLGYSFGRARHRAAAPVGVMHQVLAYAKSYAKRTHTQIYARQSHLARESRIGITGINRYTTIGYAAGGGLRGPTRRHAGSIEGDA